MKLKEKNDLLLIVQDLVGKGQKRGVKRKMVF